MKLLGFEIYKTFSRWRTYISFGAIALLVVLIEVVIKLKPGEVLHRAPAKPASRGDGLSPDCHRMMPR